MRQIDKIIFHCSASDNPKHDDVGVMRNWHQARGWYDVGYHYFIKKDGTIQDGRPLSQVGAHTAGHNTGSVGVCFHGLNDFTKPQMKAIHKVITLIEDKVGKPLQLASHRDFTNLKTCPNFVLDDFLKGKLTIVKIYAHMGSLPDVFSHDDSNLQEEVCGLDQ